MGKKSEKLLEVSGLAVKIDGGPEIVHDVDFEVMAGEVVALVGPNGAGKSTVAAALMGDKRFQTAGRVRFLGKDLLKMRVDERARAGIFMSFQNPPEVEGVSTTEIIMSGLEARGERLRIDAVRDRIEVVTNKIGMDTWFPEREANVGFSGGEKKKNEILQGLVLKPRLLILDEIDSGLDIDTADKLSEMLQHYKAKEGAGILVITHNMRILRHLEVSRTVLMRKGRVYAVGNKNMLKKVESEGFSSVFGENGDRSEK